MDGVETVPEQHFPRQHKLPEQRGRVLQQISQCAFCLQREVMAVNMDTVDLLVFLLIALAGRTDDGNPVVVLLQCGRFLPYTAIERGWQVFDNDQDFSTGMRAQDINPEDIIYGMNFRLSFWLDGINNAVPSPVAAKVMNQACW